MKNITLSMDENLLMRGREYAKEHKMSFNDLVRKLVGGVVQTSSTQWLEDLFDEMDEASVFSDGRRWTREEIQRYG